MTDILIASAIPNLCYPFIALFVWYKVNKKEKVKEVKAEEREHRINGRMDELIETKETLAYERGRKEAIAEMLLGRIRNE